MDILLVSNSTVFGRGYLDHVAGEVCDLFAGVKRVLFFPYALFDRDAYAAKVRARLTEFGYQLDSICDVEPAQRRRAVEQAEALFIGGGNTFRLLHALYRDDLLVPMRERAAAGAPLLGSSAGSIVIGPSLGTTKDMPVLQPPSFQSLGLFPFQISPHFLDPDPTSRHMGETQEERILQFLEEHATPVVGLREGSFIRYRNNAAVLKGPHTARLFRRGHQPHEAEPGSDLAAALRS